MCMSYVYVLCACLMCMSYVHVLCVCPICMHVTDCANGSHRSTDRSVVATYQCLTLKVCLALVYRDDPVTPARCPLSVVPTDY